MRHITILISTTAHVFLSFLSWFRGVSYSPTGFFSITTPCILIISALICLVGLIIFENSIFLFYRTRVFVIGGRNCWGMAFFFLYLLSGEGVVSLIFLSRLCRYEIIAPEIVGCLLSAFISGSHRTGFLFFYYLFKKHGLFARRFFIKLVLGGPSYGD